MKRYPPELSLLVCLTASACLATVPEPVTLKGHRGSVRAVAFSPDGRLLASGGAVPSEDPSEQGYLRGEVILWDAASGEKQRALVGHSGMVNCLAFSPDGKILASGGQRQYTLVTRDTAENLKLWDIRTGRELVTLLGQTHGVTCVSFSGDGKTLASGSLDGTVKLRLADRDWNVRATLKPPASRTSEEGVFTLAFHPEGEWMATGVLGGTIEIWDMTTLRRRTRLRVHHMEGHGCYVAVAPDGKTLATSNMEGVVQLWDTQTFQIRDSFTSDPDRAWGLAFSPNGKLLAVPAGKWDEPSVVLWDLSTGKRLAVLEGHTEGVSSVAFSNDGIRVASASYDGTVRLWTLTDVAD